MSRSLALVGLALAACGGGYSSYRAEHAEWSGAFPSEEADVQQTIAAVSAPAHGYQRTVLQLLVWRIEGSRWSEVPPEEVMRAPAPPRGDFAVAATLQCGFNDGQAIFYRGAKVWYLLLGGRLLAWDHYDFAPGCELRNSFRPAPDALAATERTLVARLGTCSPACAESPADYYEKGRAFARVERIEEARAMLRQGDAARESHFDRRARLPGPHASPPGPSAADARAALVRDLGGEQ